MQHLQRVLQDPAAAAAAAHHLQMHHAAQTMTINRKLHGAAGAHTHPHPASAAAQMQQQQQQQSVVPSPVYGDDNPPPLPPLRNPQKALPVVTTVAASETDTASDRPNYIYSTAKYQGQGGKGSGGSVSAHHTQQPPQPKQPLAGAGASAAASKNPNTTTFCSTPASNSKPLPSIINCPLPDIPKAPTATAKDDIYVALNGSSKGTYGTTTVTGMEETVAATGQLLPPPPPPPLPAVTGSGTGSGTGIGGTATSSSSGGSSGSSGYGTQQHTLQEQHGETDEEASLAAARLPPPPTTEELQQNGCAVTASDHSDKQPATEHDDNNFYAVTEL
ncbi:protein enabled homolog [Anopheles darlingi]|uniref:protein enabled homolog n=1 Tax=Anopheles darlingi TaxID=43151 RepID=UPI002100061F|nr:protein enabled homolog [Anopheles darlingi]